MSTSGDLSECILKIMDLDEGRRSYVGTIARANGDVRVYRATSVHTANGDGTWNTLTYGGDTGETEETAEVTVVTVEGNAIVPVEDGKKDREASVDILSCRGPDPEGRYQIETQYKLSAEERGFDYVTNTSWYGQAGSYYAEDIRNGEGRIIARRSGVYLPLED
ncbi:MAG: hypothetical protein AAF251_06330 [Pseudomonadota bacterium]